MSVDVLQGKVHKVSLWIDRHGVGVRHLDSTDAGELRTGEVKDSDAAGLGGDIEALETGIEGEDVWVISNLVFAEHFHRIEIDNGKEVIGFASDKGQMGGLIEGNAVWVGDAGQVKTMGDDSARRVDSDELVEMVDGDEDVAGARVVDSVARAAAEGDFLDEVVGSSVDDGVDAAVLIGDKNTIGARCIRNAVRVVYGAGTTDDFERAGINSQNLMLASG